MLRNVCVYIISPEMSRMLPIIGIHAKAVFLLILYTICFNQLFTSFLVSTMGTCPKTALYRMLYDFAWDEGTRIPFLRFGPPKIKI